MPGNTKGVSFGNIRKMTQEKWGEGALARLYEALPRADRDILEAAVPVGWYPLESFATILHTMDRLWGKDDNEMGAVLGVYECEHDLTTIHRLLLRIWNPSFAIGKMMEFWKRYHDTGVWNLTKVDGSHVTATLDDWGVVDEILCKNSGAYIHRMIELLGAKEVRLVHPECRGRGGRRCFFDASWK